eukprot:376882_1
MAIHLRVAKSLSQSIRIDTSALRKQLFSLVQLEGITSHSVTVSLVNDEFIRRLNSKFRRKDKSTDILSFPCQFESSDEDDDNNSRTV